MSISNRCRARGAVSSSLLFTILIIVVIGVAGWFLVVKPHMDAIKSEQAPKPVATQAAAAKSTPAPANVSAMSTGQLLAEAGKAVKDERLLAPAGNNAFEFYLKVLERQPNNPVAKEALRETFPFGANEAEQEINNRNFNEAQREIDLLAKASPDNYTLTILRSKLDAQRKTASQEQQKAQAALLAKQQAAARQRQQQEAATAEKPQPKQTQLAQESKPESESGGNASGGETQSSQASAPAQPAKVQIQDAVLVKSVPARYPSVARIRRQHGWVDVQFTVDTDGNVTDAKVIESRPSHVFNRAALRAVERWKYRPALRNGQPFPVTMRRRITFNLGSP
jgi:periplasmic protein TonB